MKRQRKEYLKPDSNSSKPVSNHIKLSKQEFSKRVSQGLRSSQQKIGKPRTIKSPEELEMLFNEWQEWVLSQTIEVELHVATRDGTPLKVTKPKPILLESFCIYAGISIQRMHEYEKGKGFEGYKEIIARLREFVTYHQLDREQLGILNTNSAKFYLVNNSRYKDVKEVHHTIDVKEPPAWLKTGAVKSNDDDQKGISGESIDFEEID